MQRRPQPGTILRGQLSGMRARRDLRGVETYVGFIGYPRSGHSLLGSLLTAHPEAVVSHELDALKFVDRNVSRTALFGLILHVDRRFTIQGRQWTDFDYAVPGQWQGRYRCLRVIGDKKGGRTTWRLAERPKLLDALRSTVRIPIRFLHVVRNPYDNITTIAQRRYAGQLPPALDRYEHMCAAIGEHRSRFAKEELLEFRYEELVANPASTLTRIGRSLGIETTMEYLDACAAVIQPEPSRSRFRVESWPDALHARVARLIDAVPWLAGYSFQEAEDFSPSSHSSRGPGPASP